MAVAPVVVTTGAPGIPGQNSAHQLIRVIDVTFDSSYPAGGEPIDFTTLGFASVQAVIDAGGLTHGGFVYDYDYANSKLLVYWTGAVVSTALAEVTAATNLAAFTVRLVVIGTQA